MGWCNGNENLLLVNISPSLLPSSSPSNETGSRSEHAISPPIPNSIGISLFHLVHSYHLVVQSRVLDLDPQFL